MESQGVAAAAVPSVEATAAAVEPAVEATVAAVEPSVEASNESLSFDDFYRSEHRHVLGLAFVLTGNQWVAEDTAQDAFAAAFRNWRSIVAYDSPGAWVRRVTCNRAASALRRRVREAKALMRLAGGRRPTSNWTKAMKRSGRRFVVCQPVKPKPSPSITWRTTACGRSPRSLTAAKAPSKPT